MKQILFIKLTLITVFIFNSHSVKSQNCTYSITNNYNVALDTDIVFKTIVYFNTRILRYDTMELKMDIIKPIGDNNTQRPIVVYFHGLNESYKYKDSHVKRMVDVMVKERGFVLASVEYKVWGLPYADSPTQNCGNILFLLNEIYSPYDISESIRASYRLVQDANDAIKYVKSRSAIDGSCSNLCFLSGFSAGGFIAGSTAFMSVAEKPTQAGNISPATYTNLFGTALTPSVSIPRTDLGPVYGSTNSYVPNVKGLLQFNSGLNNKNLIQQNDIPMFLYHSLNDPNVPADSSSPVCFTESKLYGQNTLKIQALNNGYVLGQNLVLANGNTGHDFYNTQIRLGADFIHTQINQNQCLCDSASLANVIETQKVEFEIYSHENKIIIKNNQLTHKNISAKIYDMHGKELQTLNFEFNNYKEIVIDNVNGLYFIELSGNDFNISKKIVLTTN